MTIIGNKIADNIAAIALNKPNFYKRKDSGFLEKSIEILKERHISPEKRQ